MKNIFTKKYKTIVLIFCFLTIFLFANKEIKAITDTEAQNDSTTNSTIYNLLAPIPGIGTCIDTSGNDKNCSDGSLNSYMNKIVTLAIALAGALSIIMIIIRGIQYMGDESIFGHTEAKEGIWKAVLGLIIALGSYALLNTIDSSLLGTGLNIATVESTITPTSGGGYFGVTIDNPAPTNGGGGANASKNVTIYDDFLRNASKKYGVDCTLIKAFMYAESGGVNGQKSPAGAGGLIQLMPGTFAEQGYNTSLIMDPQTNIYAGASYISRLQKNGCNGKQASATCNVANIQYLAASYNGGPKANSDSKSCPGQTAWLCTKNSGYSETRVYAPRVESNYRKLKEKGWGC